MLLRRKRSAVGIRRAKFHPAAEINPVWVEFRYRSSCRCIIKQGTVKVKRSRLERRTAVRRNPFFIPAPGMIWNAADSSHGAENSVSSPIITESKHKTNGAAWKGFNER